jgi:hypothetical protein
VRLPETRTVDIEPESSRPPVAAHTNAPALAAYLFGTFSVTVDCANRTESRKALRSNELRNARYANGSGWESNPPGAARATPQRL